MDTLYLDLETFSTIPIKNGIYRYAEKVELLLFAYTFNDQEPQVWDCTSETMPENLKKLLHNQNIIFCAHNSQFDRIMLYKTLKIKHKLWKDTMVRAYRHSLPGSLEDLCHIFKLPSDMAKKKEGQSLIHLFCKPLGKNRKLDRATKKTHPKEWQQFIDYALSDIKAMRVIDELIPDFNDIDFENEIWKLDQIINMRGINIDIDLAEKAIHILNNEKKNRDSEVQDITKEGIQSATQRDKLIEFISQTYNVTLPDMQASTLAKRLSDPDLPEELKNLIHLRLASAKTSVSKFKTLLNGINSDGKIRGTLTYYGASRTGRWSGRYFQPQNLPKSTIKSDMIETAIFAVKNNVISLFFDKPVDVCLSIIRGLIVAGKGKKLIVSDYSSIEGRVLAWLAEETWKINAYIEYDNGKGHDMYILTYANTFNIDPNSVTPKQRQLGKVLELALGYGGGVGAFLSFAKIYRIDLNELLDTPIPEQLRMEAKYYYDYCVSEEKSIISGIEEDVFIVCDGIKRLWRESNEDTSQYWVNLQNAVIDAVRYNKTTQLPQNIVIDKKGAWLRIRLPSGRYLCYPGIQINTDNEIVYWGKDQYSRKWVRLKTYGGKLSENITQAVSRDILVCGMLNAEKAGYKTILTVHDEIITEVPDNSEYSIQQLNKLITIPAKWMNGLPLHSAGYEAYRYRKD